MKLLQWRQVIQAEMTRIAPRREDCRFNLRPDIAASVLPPDRIAYLLAHVAIVGPARTQPDPRSQTDPHSSGRDEVRHVGQEPGWTWTGSVSLVRNHLRHAGAGCTRCTDSAPLAERSWRSCGRRARSRRSARPQSLRRRSDKARRSGRYGVLGKSARLRRAVIAA